MSTCVCLLWQILSHSEVVNIYAKYKFLQKYHGLGDCSTCTKTRQICHPYRGYHWCLECYTHKIKNGLGKYISSQDKIYIILNVHGNGTGRCINCPDQCTTFICSASGIKGYICDPCMHKCMITNSPVVISLDN
jgi:hypothetical protein